jgi:hypothetical protein
VRLTTGRFFERMRPALGQKVFAPNLQYRVRTVQSIRSGDSVALVNVTVPADTLPFFGPVEAEIAFFVQRDSTAWRVSDMRRFARIERRSDEIREIDSSGAYPRALKPLIIREYSSVLLSNDQLRSHFESNHARFTDLVGRFDGRDSLRMIGRTDRNVVQLNRMAIQWGAAAQDVPKEIIDEYLASASPKEKKEIRLQLQHIDKLKRIGRDSLAKYARKYKLNVAHIDSTVNLMYDLRISFANAELPWKNAVQLTVGGVVNDAIGYLYSPNGELPIISHEEYYYLEDLGEGWWIFRAG